MPTPEEVAFARTMKRRHGINLEGTCWWCGYDQPFPCPIYSAALATLAEADAAEAAKSDTPAGDAATGAGDVTGAEHTATTTVVRSPDAGGGECTGGSEGTGGGAVTASTASADRDDRDDR